MNRIFRLMLAARHVLVLTAVLGAFSTASGADTLRIRMIRAGFEEGLTAHALLDVMAMMKNTLAFKTYTLDAEARLPLPADGAVARLRVYEVTCKGNADRLSVHIVRRGKRILSTEATIRPGHPVILGGFPARSKGMRMFVLTVEPDPKKP